MAIEFNATLTQSDWDARLGAWKCDALDVPGAQVTALYENGAKRDDRDYHVEGNHIFWAAAPPPPELVLRIQIPAGLSTLEERKFELDRERFAAEREKTRTEQRWKVISGVGAAAGAILSAWITYTLNRPATHDLPQGHSSPPASAGAATTDSNASGSPASAAATTDTNASGSPASLTVIPNVFQQRFSRPAIRNPQGLRMLTALESGRTAADLPRQTYAFIWGGYLTKARNEPTAALLSHPVARANDTPTTTFEIERLAGGEIVLIAFCSNSDSVEIANLDGATLKKALLFSDPWEEAPTLLVMPLNRMLEATNREIETDGRGTYRAIQAVVR